MADFSLKAVFGLDATGVRTELKKLRSEFNDFAEKWINIGAAAAATAFVALAKGAVDLAGKLSDVSANLGIDIVAFQALEAQHKRNGVTQEQLIKSLEKTKAVVIDAAQGNEQAAKSLATLGLKAQDLIRLPLAEQYEAIAKAAAKAKDQNEAYSVVSQILGEKVGPKLMGSLRELAQEGLPAVIDSATKAGHVMSRETIAALDRAGDAIDDFKKKATIAVGEIIVNFRTEEGLKLMGLQLLKIAGDFGGRILDFITEAGGMIWAVFSGAFKGVTNYLNDALFDAIKGVASAINKILPEKFEINVAGLDALKSTGKSVSDEITEAIARTSPSTFKKDFNESIDILIKEQKGVVDALNQVDLGPEADKLRGAGEDAGASIRAALTDFFGPIDRLSNALNNATSKTQGGSSGGGRSPSSPSGGGQPNKKFPITPEVMAELDRLNGGAQGSAFRAQNGMLLSDFKTESDLSIASDAVLKEIVRRNREEADRLTNPFNPNYQRDTWALPTGGFSQKLGAASLNIEASNAQRVLDSRKNMSSMDYDTALKNFKGDPMGFDAIYNKAVQDLQDSSTRTMTATEHIADQFGKLLGK